MNILKQIKNLVTSSTLCWCLVFTPNLYASTSDDMIPNSVVKTFNESYQSLDLAVSAFKVKNKKKYLEFNKFINDNKIDPNTKMPTLAFQDGFYTFTVNNEMFSVKSQTNKEITITKAGQSVTINQDAPISVSLNLIQSLLTMKTTFHPLDLVISNSYAIDIFTGIILGALVLVAAMTAIEVHTDKKVMAAVEKAVALRAECEALKNSATALTQVQLTQIAELNVKIRDAYSSVSFSILESRDKNVFQTTRKCLSELEAKKTVVNDSKRAIETKQTGTPAKSDAEVKKANAK